MAHMLRPLILLPRWQYRCCCSRAFHHLLHSPSVVYPVDSLRSLFFIPFPSSHRDLHFRSRRLRSPDAPIPSDSEDSGSDSDEVGKKSRNEKKREARRAVRCGMELANLSPPQIKLILRVTSLEREVFDALMLVKKFGRDIREGKRRQFNYIGRLLREVEPELMEGLIKATRDGDRRMFKELTGSEMLLMEDEGEDEGEASEESEVEEEEEYIDAATRWAEGLINKDVKITNEIYSISTVEFDRQELRRLVRKVHAMLERKVPSEEKEGKANTELVAAKKSLNRFLCQVAKQLPIPN